jgi:hypothetical protein
MFILRMFQDVLEKTGIAGVLILAAYMAIGAGAVLWLACSMLRAAWRSFRWWRIRRELKVLRGDKPAPVFPGHRDLEDRRRTPRPPIRSLRTRRGDNDDAAA